MRYLITAVLVAGLALSGCDSNGERPQDDNVPADTLSQPDTLPSDSLDKGRPESPGKSEEAPGQEKKLEAAQACENSVVVNGVPALPGANYLTVDKMPRQLKIEFTDCPHPRAVVRDNYVRTGYGSGEIWVSLRVRRGGTFATPRYYLANEGASISSGHKFLITDTTGRLQKAITRPGGWGYPEEATGIATEPVSGVWNLRLHSFRDGDPGPVELKVNVFHSEIQENGRIGTRALVIREAE